MSLALIFSLVSVPSTARSINYSVRELEGASSLTSAAPHGTHSRELQAFRCASPQVHTQPCTLLGIP